jgi:hypothetical protein
LTSELNNFLDPDKEAIIDSSIICPKCGKSDKLRIAKFSFNIYENTFNELIEVGCYTCCHMFNVDKVKIQEEEYTEVHKRLRFSK